MPSLSPAEIDRMTRRGLRLAQFTVAYNLAEGGVAIAAGLAAGLISLLGFGLDSGIESIAAVLVGLRLAARLRNGEADERRERRTLRLVAVTFFLLAGYVTMEGIRDVVVEDPPDTSALTGAAWLDPVATSRFARSSLMPSRMTNRRRRQGWSSVC